jgi:hypothetical protein
MENIATENVGKTFTTAKIILNFQLRTENGLGISLKFQHTIKGLI